MLVIAFDQSTSITAYALMDSNNKELIDFGHKKFNNKVNTDEKISNVKNWINQIIEEKKPEVFALEDVQQQINADTYKKLAKLLGVIENNFYEKDYLYLTIPPTQWKSYIKIKGRKRAEQKKNTIAFIKDKFGIDVIEDEADAIGIALYACKEVNKIKN